MSSSVASTKSCNAISSSSTPRLMLFDLAVGGHHPSYIRHLIEYWRNEKMAGHLFIVVSPEFLQKHADVVGLANSSIEFVAISSEESTRLAQAKRIIQRIFLEWKLHCKYATDLQIDHSLLMYFDHLQLPIVFGRRAPCSFSGIYFRPTFHYKHFDNHVFTLKDAWRGWRQKVLLFLAMKNRQMAGLLSLDPYAVPYIKALSPKGKVIKHLPDPVTVVPVDPQQVQELKQDLGIEAGRKTFLLFGRLSDRKGIFQVLEAAKLLTKDVAQRCCLLLVGEIPVSIKSRILYSVAELRQESSIQFIIKDEYQPEESIPLYVSVADVVLAPYQRHVGMSGILMLSSAYEKLILSSNYGLLGQLTRQYQLGASIETSAPKSLSEGISMFFDDSKSLCLDLEKSAKFFSLYNPQKFSSYIFTLISQSIDT